MFGRLIRNFDENTIKNIVLRHVLKNFGANAHLKGKRGIYPSLSLTNYSKTFEFSALVGQFWNFPDLSPLTV